MAGYWFLQPYRLGARVRPDQRCADFGEVLARMRRFRSANTDPENRLRVYVPSPRRRMSDAELLRSASTRSRTQGLVRSAGLKRSSTRPKRFASRQPRPLNPQGISSNTTRLGRADLPGQRKQKPRNNQVRCWGLRNRRPRRTGGVGRVRGRKDRHSLPRQPLRVRAGATCRRIDICAALKRSG
jgi:hypothetical protein